MKKNQITTLCKIIISALLSGGTFYYAANCDLPWTILLSVLGTITAILTTIFFFISYDQVILGQPLGQPGSGRGYGKNIQTLSPEEFENEDSEMIANRIVNHSFFNSCGNMTFEDKFFNLTPATHFCNFYIKYILDFIRNERKELNTMDHFFALITSDPYKVIQMTLNFNHKPKADIFKEAPDSLRHLLNHLYGIEDIYKNIDLGLYMENGAKPEHFISESGSRIKTAINSYSNLLLRQPLKERIENIPAEVKEEINELLHNSVA